MSFRFCQKPPRPAFQFTSRSEFTGPRGAGLKNSFRFEKKLFSSDSRTGEGKRPSFNDGSITEGAASLMTCGFSSGMNFDGKPGSSPNNLRRRAGKKDVWPDCG